jgi:LysR family hydrogen peroxide-inducible transcriptional activator
LMDGSSLSTLVQMVSAGMGITLIPQMAIELEQRAASVSVAQFSEPRPFRRVGMVWRKTNPMHNQLAEIANALRK